MTLNRRALLTGGLAAVAAAVALRDFALPGSVPRVSARDRLVAAIAARPGAEKADWYAVPADFFSEWIRLGTQWAAAPVLPGMTTAMAGFGYLGAVWDVAPDHGVTRWVGWWEKHPEGLARPVGYADINTALRSMWNDSMLDPAWLLLPGRDRFRLADEGWEAGIASALQGMPGGAMVGRGPRGLDLHIGRVFNPTTGRLIGVDEWRGPTMLTGGGDAFPILLPL